jgi:hypothetical protein
LLTLNTARFNPENMADCEMQKAIPIHTRGVMWCGSQKEMQAQRCWSRLE